MARFRKEKDVMGSVEVPSDSYYGIQTVRASNNFNISGLKIHPELNKAIVNVKIAAAKANTKLKLLNKKTGNAIIKACKEILKGEFDDQFILDVYQAGAGTPWHMNVNEVIANIALELLKERKGTYKIIDPHNHVNMNQSTNDVIPTSMRISSLILTKKLEEEVSKLIKSLKKKGREFMEYAKTGRTHLQDAVPITLGQEFTAWADNVEKRLGTIEDAKKNLYSLSIGGTAIGTGLNAHPRFAQLVVKNLKKQTKLRLESAKDKIEETQFMGDFVDLSSSLNSLAVDLTKICNDIRLLSSGPRTGLHEIILPKVEPGSSIMPGKFNPSIVEMLNMVCYQVMGNSQTIRECAAAGQLELNVMTPVISHNLLQNLDMLRNGIKTFNEKCIKDIKADVKTLKHYFDINPSIGTVLNTVIGYDRAAKIVAEAIKKNKSVEQIVVEKGILSEKEAKELFNIKNFKLK